MDNKETAVVSAFFEDFSASIKKVLVEKLDEDVFTDIHFSVSSVQGVSAISQFSKSNVLSAFEYVTVGMTGQSMLFIPDQLIAVASDIIMGGEGKDVYNGSLSELEVNASLNLINEILDKVKATFHAMHSSDIGFSSEMKILTRVDDDFQMFFSNSKMDFAITYNLRLTDELFYDIVCVFNWEQLRSTFVALGVIEEDIIGHLPTVFSTEVDSFSGISNLSNIMINIDAELGRCKFPIKQLLNFTKGSIIELDTEVDDDLKIIANGLEVARARPVVVDEYLGIQITKILTPDQRVREN